MWEKVGFIMTKILRITEAATQRCWCSKRCSENMQQIYKRAPMPKCDFNKFAKQLIILRSRVVVISCGMSGKNSVSQTNRIFQKKFEGYRR